MTLAGCVKLLDTKHFISAIDRIGVLPSWSIVPCAILIIQSEIWLGLALVVGFRTRIVAALLSALVSLFIVVIAVALFRGMAGDCGCFGPIGSEQIGRGVIIRDALILISCLWISFQGEPNRPERQKIAEEKPVDYS